MAAVCRHHVAFIAPREVSRWRVEQGTSNPRRARVLLQLVEGEFDFYGNHFALKRLPRVACYFAKFLPDFAEFRDAVQKVKSFHEFKRLVREHFTR